MELSLAKPALIRKPPLLLKDYLLDDLSSCSSSGFRSYPRKQCCTTVRFLLEMDLKNKPPKYIKKPPHKSPSKLSSSSSSSSAFQRASTAVINAVKSPSSLSNRLKLTLLPRTLSRKLLKRSFWKRTDRKEIQRREPINQIVVKNSPPPPPSDFTCSPTSGDSRNSTSDSNCKSNSWSDSDFTVSDISSGGNNSAVKILNKDLHDDVVSMESTNNNLSKDKAMMSRKRVGVIVGGYDSMEPTTSSNSGTNSNNLKKQWPNHEEDKEQFSPVSVFDCPFDDDDEVSSPFQHRLARMEGTKKRLMKNIKKFERLTQLEPVNLEKRIVLSDSDRDSNGSPQLHSSESTGSRGEDFIVDSEEEENNIEATDHKSFKLLQLVKATTTAAISTKLKADYDKLLLDFFKEGIEMGNSSLIGRAACSRLSTTSSVSLDDHELLNVAKDWIAGQYCELFLGWEMQKNREAYIQDMERVGKWRKSNEEEKHELALELEVEVFASLMDELFTDLVSS